MRRRLHRTALMVAVATVGVIAVPALASTPADSGTLTAASGAGVVTAAWSGTISGAAGTVDDCSDNATTSPNDHHTFTLAYPAGLPSGATVTMAVTETAATGDSILQVTKGGASLGSSDNGSVGGSESLSFTNPAAGSYDAITCAFAGAGTYTASVTLTTTLPNPTATVGGTSTTAGPATFGNYNLASIAGTNASGEPSIGVSWLTGDVFFQANLNTVKAQFPDYNVNSQPKLTDVSCLATTLNSLDPIGYVDSQTGRVGASQLQANPAGLNSITSFFDDTATTSPTAPQTTCMPSTGGGAIAGPDHQTLGGGVYPKVLPTGVTGPQTTYPDAIYYCSQAIEASICSRSDDGGTAFDGTATAFTAVEGCGGLHGHVRVGPEGNVYLPNKSCNGTSALAVSTDAGTTYTEYPVTGSTSGTTDPSVSADRAGNVYFGYVGSDGLPAISTSADGGKTWGNRVTPGDALGIKRAVWAETIAGDNGRAAFAFMGSTTAGDSDAATYGEDAAGTTYTGGTWDLYVAITVDGGKTYRTVDVTPNDPVQRGSICTAGTTCMGNTRNLLDFMDITVDKTGHVLVGYADGCTATCVTSTKVSDNLNTAQGYIARQTDGPLLFVTPGVTTGPAPALPDSKTPVLLVLVALSVGSVGFGLRRIRRGSHSIA